MKIRVDLGIKKLFPGSVGGWVGVWVFFKFEDWFQPILFSIKVGLLGITEMVMKVLNIKYCK